jgi:hypothetical protein
MLLISSAAIVAAGCNASTLDDLDANGLVTLAPAEAVLVIGRNDTLTGSVTFAWPQEANGGNKPGDWRLAQG